MRKSELLLGILLAVLILVSFSARDVSASSGLSIGISTVDGIVSATDRQATFLVTVTNNEASGSRHVFLTLKDPALPSGSQWDVEPFFPEFPTGWTYSLSPSELDVAHGQSAQSTLTINGPAGDPPGLRQFRVVGYWVAYIIDNPVRYVYTSASSPQIMLFVQVKLMVPEYLLGTILGLAGMFGALGAYYFQKRKQFSP